MKSPANRPQHDNTSPQGLGKETTGKVVFFDEEKLLHYLAPNHRRELRILQNIFGKTAVYTALQTGREIFQQSQSFVKACNVGYIDLLNASNGVKTEFDTEEYFFSVLSMYKDYMMKQERDHTESDQLKLSQQDQEAKIIDIFEKDYTAVTLEETSPYSVDENGDVRVPDDVETI